MPPAFPCDLIRSFVKRDFDFCNPFILEILNPVMDLLSSMTKGVNFNSSKVMVTGAAGFLGSHLTEALISLGCEVYGLDTFISGFPDNLKALENNEKFHFIQANISEPVEFEGDLDFIFHFASIADPIRYQKYPIETLRANTFGTYNLLELARKKKAGLLFASTSEIYGDAQVVPTPETYWGNVNPVGPRACYDEGKRCGEAFCISYVQKHAMDIKIVRIFNTYGPRLRDGRAVPEFVSRALKGDVLRIDGNGKQTRSFCFVSDLIRGILLLAEKGPVGEAVNIGNDSEITVLELAKAVLEVTASQSKIEFSPRPIDDPNRRCPKLEKARSLLGYAPEVTLKEGLNLTVEWFKGS